MYKTSKLHSGGHDAVEDYRSKDNYWFVYSSYYLRAGKKMLIKTLLLVFEYAHSKTSGFRAVADKLIRIHPPFG